MKFDHAGIATDDTDQLANLYVDLFGAEIAHQEVADGLSLTFLDLGNGYFELLEPVEEGAVSRYLERNGPGIHHLAIQTDDIEAALETAAEMGIELIDEEPRSGAWGHDIAFLHPKSTGGVLIEFVEH